MVANIEPRRLKEFGAGTFFYSALEMAEGVGLLLLRPWAEYLTVLATALLLPLEIYELAHKVTALRVAVLVVNLASQEYFKVTQAKAGRTKVLRARVVDCVFEDWKDGDYKIISFFAKRARGMMARHAIDKRADSAEALTDFRADGYRFAERASEPDRLVFRRRQG